MQAVVETIQQAKSRGIVLFDKRGEMCQLNIVAAEIMWNENNKDEIFDELVDAVRTMSSSGTKAAAVRKMRFDVRDCEITCTLRKVVGERYRAILKIDAAPLQAIA